MKPLIDMDDTPIIKKPTYLSEDSNFDISGVLYKRRGGWATKINDFQPRFFILKDNVLMYFKTTSMKGVKMDEVRGEIQLGSKTVTAFGAHFDGSPNPYTILVKGEEEKWKLCAEDEESFIGWRDAIEMVVREGSGSFNSWSSGQEEHKGEPHHPPGHIRRQSSSSTSVKKRKPKRGPPPKKKRSWLSNPDNLELIFVMLLLNFCLTLLLLYPSSSHLFSSTICVVANVVVGYSFYHRARRPILTAIPSEVPPPPEPDSPINLTRPSMDPGVEESKDSHGVLGKNYVEVNGEVFPIAGSTIPHFDPEKDELVDGHPPDHSWMDGDGTKFNVRKGPDYSRNKQKAPSAEALYECVGVDFIGTDYKIDEISSEVALPDTDSINTHDPNVPPIFVVNVQFPTEPPGWTSVDDGPGIQVVIYFRIKDEVCKQLQVLNDDWAEGEEKEMVDVKPATKLFKEYCIQAFDDPTFRSRFKIIAYVENMSEMGLPGFITSYNAKPALIRKTGTLFRGPDNKYIEMDINVHRFATLPRKGLTILMSRFDEMMLYVGFVIEGRCNEELPECLFGTAYLQKPDPEKSIPVFDQN